MKKPIILLALFAVLMVATLVWSAGRNRDAPGVDQPENCNGPPKKNEFNPKTGQVEQVVDTDKLGGWASDCGPQGAKSIANGFTKGTLLNPAEIRMSGNLASEARLVGRIASDKDPRVIKLRRSEGGAVEVTAQIPGEDDQHLCLCSAGDVLARDNHNGQEICSVALKSRSCQDEDRNGTLAVPPDGATITFRSVRPAVVRSVK
jgi:hypothetical protein